MDPAIHRGELPVGEAYRRFARREAFGVCEVYQEWAERVADEVAVLGLLQTLPPTKRQPNLVFAATRFHGASGPYSSFRATVTQQWATVRATILSRATQINEAARCAVLLPYLAALPQPLALIEVGAAAGLCLLPDRYSYRYDDGTALDPEAGPSEVVIGCRLGPGVLPPAAMPRVVWRAGIDLAPVDIADADRCAWLETLIWPDQDERVERLRRALALARRDPVRLVRGDLLQELPGLAAEAPAEATLVVFHSAVLAYLTPPDRARFVELVGALPGHWISNEGRRVVAGLAQPVGGDADDGRFLLAVDGQSRALTDPHGRSIDAFSPD